ncbi:alpha/beta hydrolase [Phenylobacterium sp.]|uniref:alpha/beta hydrolase n=1 Tax=Phenylobacterium sp. TaxID=1871053 RepID=UPI002FC92C52
MRKTWLPFAVGVLLILAGSLLAHAIQTTGGVTVEDVRFPGDKGTTLSALVYTPPGASATKPAPAVLVSHGYINTREMQSAFAIELARRGFVVLAIDQSGHGYSTGIVGSNDFGGPAALRYLKSLPQVDRGNIGLEGHSLGGGPVVGAAASDPDGYRSAVLEGSTPAIGAVFGSQAKAELRNLALVFGGYDEFAPLMWQVERGSDVAKSKALQALFGTTAPVVEGRVYGDLKAGTARVLYNPAITHPWEHFSVAGVAPAVDWFQQTLDGEANPLPPTEQIWIWKEVGTLIAFAGLVVLLLGTFQLLLAAPWFSGLVQPAAPAAETRDRRWWMAFVLTASIPAITYLPLMFVGQAFLPIPGFPQWVTNQLLVWALANAVITLLLGLVLKSAKPAFATDWLKSAAIAVATVAVGYASLALVDALWHVDYRFWVLGLKPLDGLHLTYALAYLPLWTAFFLVALRALHANLGRKGEGKGQYLTAALAMCLGFIVLLSLQYASLFATGVLAIDQPLNTIIGIQFVPLLAIVGVIAVFTYRRTNSYVPGALICALFITWYVVSGTATHWSPDFQLPIPGRG